ncbi:hypothetical protein C6P40_002245 [Pichia californica]|uniref:THO complex subunit 2 n=1 Tax=Pichia californica TaxID=460514 RepID=A0A9P6WQU3_9ASCO|nr:hypothetical protein C6P40_002245 [[Candida] californica]
MSAQLDQPSDPSFVQETLEKKFSYSWKFITDEYINSPSTGNIQLLEKLSNNEINTNEIFYEILLTVTEYSKRISNNKILHDLISVILSHYTKVENRAKISEDFIILASSFKSNSNLSLFIKESPIDIRFKILHLNKSILLSEKIFPEVGKYQYNDLRSRIFTVDSFSSLHEASEGYSKFISQLYSYIDLQPNDISNVPVLLKVLNRINAEYNLDNSRCFLLLLNILSHYIDSNKELVLEIFKNSLWWNESKYNFTIQTTIIDYLFNYVGIKCLELKLITLLIKYNILDFESIYNSLGPFDYSIIDSSSIKPIENTEFIQLYNTIKQETLKKSKLSNASALALAAPLLPDSDDEDVNESSSLKSTKIETKKIENVKLKEEISILEKAKLFRKLNFLEYLIEFEMIDQVLFILVQYPQIPLISNKIADLLNNILDKYITPFYLEYVDNLNISKSLIVINNNNNNNNNNPIKSIDDFLKFIIRFISFNKYKLARNSSLLTKLLRIMKHSLNINSKSSEFWLQFFRLNIFPCLSFTNNIPVINEAFEVFVNNYSLETRYNIYGEYQITVKQDEITKLNYDITEKKTRDLLKRLSVENVNIICRSLNKLCSINPIATSNAFITHIESYNSLIDLVCESSKFFNDYSWDVITFQLLNKLNSNREVIQNDGLNYSLWFSNLSQFIGKLGQLYPESFQLYPILINIIKSLQSNDFNILSTVKQLLDLMTGIKPTMNLTSKQIMKMNAETSLRKIAYISIQDNRENCFKSCIKLINIMVENNIFSEFFILLCHVFVNLIDLANDKPLKFVNQKCDEVSSLIHTFTSALDLNLNKNIFKKNMISLNELIKDYKIQPQWAFEIWRKTWSIEIIENNNKSDFIFDKIKDDLIETLYKLDWNLLNVKFYLTFWQLSLYDINFNDLSYMIEYSDLKSQITGNSMKLRQQQRILPQKEIRNLELKNQKLMSIISNIREDMLKHEKNSKLIMERLEFEKKNWFEDSDKNFQGNELNERIKKRSLIFLQSCALPRLQHSSFDAVFVSKFLFFFNQLKIPGYSLKYILDNLFMIDILPITLYINTTGETENLALFYQLTLEKLNEWWCNKEIYEKESFKFDENLDHSDYCKLLFKWHENLLKQILKSLDSKSYTTRNNAILFLKVILVNFPCVQELADPLTNKLEEIVENDGRDDITLASRALIGLIKFRESKFISVWDFYEMEIEEKEEAMKAKEEKNKIENERLKEIESKRLEEEKKEHEKLRSEKINNAPTKPYGLVGLSAKKPEVEKNTVVESLKIKENDSAKIDKSKSEVKKEVIVPLESMKKVSPPASTPSAPKSTTTNINSTSTVSITNLPKSPLGVTKTKVSTSQTSQTLSHIHAPKIPPQAKPSATLTASINASNARRDNGSNKTNNNNNNNNNNNSNNDNGGKWSRYNRNDQSRYYEDSNSGNGSNLIGNSPVTSGMERKNSSSNNHNNGKNQYYGGQQQKQQQQPKSQFQQPQQQQSDRGGGGQYMKHSNSHGGGYYKNRNNNNNNNNNSNNSNNSNNNNTNTNNNNNNYNNRNHSKSNASIPLPPPATPPPPSSSSSSAAASNSSTNNNKRRMPPLNDYMYKRSRRQ